MEDRLPASPPPLEYATPRSDARVLYTREGDRATVVIRRPERRAKAAMDSAAGAVGQLIFILAIACLLWFWPKPIWLLLLIPVGLALFGLSYGIAWLSFARLGRPIVVELTPAELTVRNMDARPRNLRLKLGGLYAIYVARHSPLIWIRRHGGEMEGFLATPDMAEAERIAAFLRDAAGLGPDASHESPLASSPPT